jgi:hypothetical protein
MPDRLSRLSKVLLALAGYAIAFLIASAVMYAHIKATSGPEWQGDSGMLAFGDSVLFAGTFCLAAIPATVAALYWLRPVEAFWRIASIAALAIATTAVAAALVYLVPRPTPAGSGPLGYWPELAPLRILAAPGFALASCLALIFAPTRSARLGFLAAMTIEALSFLAVSVIWWRGMG